MRTGTYVMTLAVVACQSKTFNSMLRTNASVLYPGKIHLFYVRIYT